MISYKPGLAQTKRLGPVNQMRKSNNPFKANLSRNDLFYDNVGFEMEVKSSGATYEFKAVGQLTNVLAMTFNLTSETGDNVAVALSPSALGTAVAVSPSLTEFSRSKKAYLYVNIVARNIEGLKIFLNGEVELDPVDLVTDRINTFLYNPIVTALSAPVATASTAAVIVDADYEWTLASNQTFAVPAKLSGFGPQEVIINFSANAGAARNATLTLTSAGQTSTVVISQPAP